MDRKADNIEHYIQSEEFKRWVKHPTEEDIAFWENWLTCHPEKQEEVSMAREWVLSMSHYNHAPAPGDQQEVLHQILKADKNFVTADSPDSIVGKGHWNFVAKWHIAAGLALLIASVAAFMTIKFASVGNETVAIVTKQNPTGVKSQIKLPDGTMVWLNSDSKLLYPEAFTASERKVTLFGEAFFEVVEDKKRPFKVRSGNVLTTALGTSFNIQAEDLVTVSLTTGKVKVDHFSATNDLRNTHYLTPGQELTYHQGQVPALNRFNPEEVVGWKDGIIIFKNATREEVISRLEKWYGVTIDQIGTANAVWNVTARFENQSLENIMHNLSFTVGFEYALEGKKMTITSPK